MRALAIRRTGVIEETPLEAVQLDEPTVGSGQILLKVLACGVCHTELDQIEGRLAIPSLPVVPGHQIVGEVVGRADGAGMYAIGDRVGVTWLNWSCGQCGFCRSGRENLCDDAKWTGHDVDGGYAEYVTAYEKFSYPIPERYSDVQAAPLLCAGVIGYRALRLAELCDGDVMGLFGFGASGHIAIQVIKHRCPASPVFVFTRGEAHRELALSLGADWAGGADDKPPEMLDRAIDFTPVGETVKRALSVSRKGGRVIINAIRKTTPIPQLDYGEYVWGERTITSVANVTARDAREFLPLAAQIGIECEVEEFELAEANEALVRLKQGRIKGVAVLRI